jgi:hypothetical protein
MLPCVLSLDITGAGRQECTSGGRDAIIISESGRSKR